MKSSVVSHQLTVAFCFSIWKLCSSFMFISLALFCLYILCLVFIVTLQSTVLGSFLHLACMVVLPITSLLISPSLFCCHSFWPHPTALHFISLTALLQAYKPYNSINIVSSCPFLGLLYFTHPVLISTTVFQFFSFLSFSCIPTLMLDLSLHRLDYKGRFKVWMVKTGHPTKV